MRAKQGFGATQEHANIAIGEADDAGRFVGVNAGFSALTGYSRDELLGRTLFDLTHPDDARGRAASFTPVMCGVN